MRRSFWKNLAGIIGAVLLGGAAYADSGWQIVVPTKMPGERTEIAKVFASRLKQAHQQPIAVHQDSAAAPSQILEQVLRTPSAPYSLVLMSEEVALIGNAAKNSAQHLSHYAPLLVFLETRWCLFVRADSPLTDPTQLLNWARQKSTAPRIAVPVTSGRVRLWVQGMAQRTGRAWQMDVYGINGEFAQILNQGTDLALGRCDQQWKNAHRIRILAKGADSEDGFLPHVPKFSDVSWLPFGNGWLAWLAPKSVPQAQRQAMAQQLYDIARQPAVHAYLKGTEQITTDFSPLFSEHYLNDFASTWNQIGHLLLGEDFGDLSKMQGLAKPMR